MASIEAQKNPFVALTVELTLDFSSTLSIVLPTDFIPPTLSGVLV
jgi:hypothetical protein